MPTSTQLLPNVVGRADYVPIQQEVALWLPAIRTICQRHGIASEPLERISSGTNVVFAAGTDSIVKLYPPYWMAEREADRTVAEYIHNKLGIATPEIRAYGVLEGWPYLVMQRLVGVQLHDVWTGLDHTSQLRIVAELGEILARLHALPSAGFAHLAPKWAAVMADQPAKCVQHHRSKGVAEHWLQQIPGYLARVAPLDPPGVAPVILNGDFHDGHVLVIQDHGHWRPSGLFDFDDAMLGFHESDFASPGLFIMAGRRTLLRTFLRAYGYGDAAIDAALSARLLAYTLLSRYRDLNWMLADLVADRRCTTLDELATAIYVL
jgi:hygromycin-B 7''-O-kinase